MTTYIWTVFQVYLKYGWDKATNNGIIQLRVIPFLLAIIIGTVFKIIDYDD